MKIENFKAEWEEKEYGNQFADTAVVCKGSEVKHCRMGEHTRLKSYAELRSSTIGDYTIISSYSIINASDIGKFNSMGPGVFIGLWEHNRWVSTHSFYLSEACGGFVKGFGDYEQDHERTIIGNDVWIGAGAFIVKGVHIGDGAIIGGATVVTKDVAPYAVVVGNPARLLKYRFDRSDIEYLCELKWWDFDRRILQDMTNQKVWDSVEKVRVYCRRNGVTAGKGVAI